jgi:hypothetical protein
MQKTGLCTTVFRRDVISTNKYGDRNRNKYYQKSIHWIMYYGTTYIYSLTGLCTTTADWNMYYHLPSTGLCTTAPLRTGIRTAIYRALDYVLPPRTGLCTTINFLPTARSAVGLGITLSYFHSFYPRNGYFDILTFGQLLELTQHYSTLLLYYATVHYLTLFDAV